jgi:hypothetical protein
LTGLAISQPLLAVFGDNPTIFTTYDVRGWRLIGFAVVIAVVPPVLLWLVITGVEGVSRKVGRLCFLIVCGSLGAAAAIQLAKWAGISSRYGLEIIALASGFGLAAAYRRFRPVETWTRYLAPLPVLSLLLFLLASPTGDVLRAAPDSAPAEGGADLPPVVLLVLDELPTKSLLDADGGIDSVRFPNLAAFADEATWYRHYTTMSPFTASAVPSMLTGRVPQPDRPLFTNHPDSIFSLLAPTHELTVFESATLLCNDDDCAGRFGRSPRLGPLLGSAVDVFRSRVSFGEHLDATLDDFVERNADVVTGTGGSLRMDELLAGVQLAAIPERAVDFVESFEGTSSEPGFYYLHLMLPHRPFLFDGTGDRYRHADPLSHNLPEPDQRHSDWWSSWPATVTEQRHLLQATYTDAIVGAILEGLEDTSLYDDALVVVVADHGVTFAPRTDSREPSDQTLGDIAYVPLLVKEPAQRTGRTDDSNVMSIDLLPTIADIVGVSPDWPIDGARADSAEVARRGDGKIWYDMTNLFSPALVGIVKYSDAATFPSAADRHIGPISRREETLEGLFDALNTPGVIGKPIDELNPTPLGSVRLDDVTSLRRPPTDQPPIGVITGTVRGLPDGIEDTGIFLLAIDGIVVTGSRITPDDEGALQIHTLLPERVLQTDNDLRAAVMTFVGALELTVE